MGHNEFLGWTLVSNEPGIADTWRVRFSGPEEPLAYEYDGAWRDATEWQETIRVRKNRTMEQRTVTFRKTHHGPIVRQENETTFLAANIAGLHETIPLRQSMAMVKSHNLAEFREALAMMQLLFMNVLYADCQGNIQYVYAARVPRRDPRFDWSKSVDGGNPATEWNGFHPLDELPQVLNPSAGYLQNCNSTPLITTEVENPRLEDFPPYMIVDAQVYRRRALRSREILADMQNISFEHWQRAAFDGEVYWAREALPSYADHLIALEAEQPELARLARPLLEHLLEWDCQISEESTAATLCHAWYEQLFGPGYPGETMRELYKDRPAKQLEALVQTAQRLTEMHGNWKVPYGRVYRSQRSANTADLIDARFSDVAPSLPALGGHGPMGTIFTQYYSPSIDIPLVYTQRRRFGMVGTSYLAAWEFTSQGVRGASVVPFGTNGNPESPHFFDQAELLQQRRLKPELFYPDDVRQGAVRSYHPGEQ